MSKQIDHIFKEKLFHQKTTPSPSAWERVEHNLSKKKEIGWQLKIAASILVIIGSGLILRSIYIADHPTPPNLTRHIQKPFQENILSEKPKNNRHTIKTLDNKQLGQLQPVKKNNTQAHKAPSKNSSGPNVSENMNPVAMPQVVENNEAIESISPPEATINPADINPHFKLVIPATVVNEKYLTKNNITEATTEEKKSSGIKRLIDIAQELKNPIAEFRDKKNEILAFNYSSHKNDKQ